MSLLTFKDEKLRKKAQEELNEFEEQVQDKLEKFRNLILDEKDLKCPLEDQFLIRYLRAKKFNVDKSFKLLKRYYTVRREYSDLFRDLYPTVLAPFFRLGLQGILAHRDDQGRQIFIFRAGNWNPNLYNLDELFRLNYIILEEMTRYPETQVNGIIFITDFEGLSLYNASKFTLKHALRMVKTLQGGFPARIAAFHMVNQPYIFNMLYTMVKPLLKAKLIKRVHFHGYDLESLHQHINPNILPHSLGGNCAEKDSDFIQNMIDKNEYFKDLLNYGYQNSSS